MDLSGDLLRGNGYHSRYFYYRVSAEEKCRMKKATMFVLAAALTISMTGCGSSQKETEAPKTEAATEAKTEAEDGSCNGEGNGSQDGSSDRESD